MNKSTNSLQTMVNLFLILSSFTMLYWLFSYSNFGIDFTDEGFYLNWISNPYSYPVSSSQFGFVYHPLYLIAGEDIANLRQLNLLITFLLAWTVVILTLQIFAPNNSKVSLSLFSVSLALSTSVFNYTIFFGEWLNSPSYNTLTFQSLLIVAIGLFLSFQNTPIRLHSGLLIMAIGGVLSFMAKPSTALLLYITLIFTSLSLYRFKQIKIFFVYTMLFYFSIAIVIDKSIIIFYNRLRQGYELMQSLDAGHSLVDTFRIDFVGIDSRFQLYILLLHLILFLLTYCSIIAPKFIDYSILILVIIHVIVIMGLFNNLIQINLGAIRNRFSGISFFGFMEILFFGLIITTILVLALVKKSLLKNLGYKKLTVIIVMAVFPYLYSFGSNNNYWIMGYSVIFFWITAFSASFFLFLEQTRSWNALIPLSVAVQLLTAFNVYSGIQNPYRQPQELYLNDSEVQIGITKSRIIVTDSYASYFKQIQETVKTSNFKTGDPVIDLSGHSPLTLYLLGSEAVGSPWLIGGYKGSENYAFESLLLFSCEKLSKSWILTEPDGPRLINLDVLIGLGLNFPDDYELRGTWQTPKNSSGWELSRTQLFYSPSKSRESMEKCLTIRDN
jgi:hypothetical protein